MEARKCELYADTGYSSLIKEREKEKGIEDDQINKKFCWHCEQIKNIFYPFLQLSTPIYKFTGHKILWCLYSCIYYSVRSLLIFSDLYKLLYKLFFVIHAGVLHLELD